MNAKFGIIVRSVARQSMLISMPRETRTWGSETIEVGNATYSFASLPGVKFGVFLMRGFIQSRLPPELQGADAEFVSMDGTAIDAYEAWVRGGGSNAEGVHLFETGMMALVAQAGVCAVLLAPDNDRLEDFVELDVIGLIKLLRENFRDLGCAHGFVCVVKHKG